MYSIRELREIKIYINKNIKLLSDVDSIDMIISQLERIIIGQKENDFELPNSVKEALFQVFFDSESPIGSFTPKFIRCDSRCIEESINRDINSINYIDDFDDETKEKVKALVTSKDVEYTLSLKAPDFIKHDFEIIKKLLLKNIYNADFVDWDYFAKNEEQLNELLKMVCTSSYILKVNASEYLRNNLEVIMSSLKRSISSAQHIGKEGMKSSEEFEYLLQNRHKFSREELGKRPLCVFKNSKTLNKGIRLLDTNNFKLDKILSLTDANKKKDEVKKTISKFMDRYFGLFIDAFSVSPSIKSFMEISAYNADLSWKKHKYDNANLYKNVFGKLTAEIQKSNRFEDAINNQEVLLTNMKKVLGDKYYLLENLLKDLYDFYHSNRNCVDIIDIRNSLSRLCALYAAKCKELYRKEEIDKCTTELKKWFTVRKDNKRIFERQKLNIQRNKLAKRFVTFDEGLYEFLSSLSKKEDAKELTIKFAQYFLVDGFNSVDDFYERPEQYSNYIRFVEAQQLVRRLNLGNIKYTDIELTNYRDIIHYNSDKLIYEIDKGFCKTFEDKKVLKEIDDYLSCKKAFNWLKEVLIMKAKEIVVSDEEVMNSLEKDISKKNLPFTDEYYVFDRKKMLESFTINDLRKKCTKTKTLKNADAIFDDNTYELLKTFISNSGLIWFLLMNDNISVDHNTLNMLINTMHEIVKFSKLNDYRLDSFNDYMEAAIISSSADEQAMAILGKENIIELCTDLVYTDEDPARIIQIAKELVCKRALRKDFTVPFINGKTSNYMYSMYDIMDDSYLMSGIDTHSCFKCDGTDNDFFHYCALDKNGFVIKITDNEGNMVARASGFRDGNTVLINQLRTIYDLGNNDYANKSVPETLQIINTLRTACLDIILFSINEESEKVKIKNIFITKSYAMQTQKENVSENVTEKIRKRLMLHDKDDEDWESFIERRNLKESYKQNFFTTDLIKKEVPLICLVGSSDDENNIEFKDVAPIYKRTRNQIMTTCNITPEIVDKVNKIRAMGALLEGKEYKKLNIPKSRSIVFIGDNWYLAFMRNRFYAYSIPGDKEAAVELLETREEFNKYLLNNFDSNAIENLSKEMGTKVYRFTNNKKDNDE